MESIKLYASDVKSLTMKVQDYMNQHGEYEHLYIEKQDEHKWFAELTFPKRGLYIGLTRSEKGA